MQYSILAVQKLVQEKRKEQNNIGVENDPSVKLGVENFP